ncbi:hypothetical protein [Dyadobacter luticola]|uniref:Uncharacterized protein n=1 Tax=Dyadobacter luticola TaxID=1979387 RepID=A0A5R9L417_9BACT|nr:hypothetical protein [Dyadobacter luticola]TLV03332.1 hypothetical protein FEN17_06890 [Dyadobacter luticola]
MGNQFRNNLATPYFQGEGGISGGGFQLNSRPLFGGGTSLSDRVKLGFDTQLHLNPEVLKMMIPLWLEPVTFYGLLSSYPLPTMGSNLFPVLPAPASSPGTSATGSALPPGPPPVRSTTPVAGPDTAKSGSVGDLLGAIAGIPPVVQLREQAVRRLTGDWNRLGRGGQILLGSYAGAMALAGGTTAYITDPDARKMILGAISNRDIPLPGTPLSLKVLASDKDVNGMILTIDLGSVLSGK